MGHLAHVPKDRRDPPGRGRVHRPAGCRSARPREPVHDAGRLLRPARRQRRDRRRAQPLTAAVLEVPGPTNEAGEVAAVVERVHVRTEQ